MRKQTKLVAVLSAAALMAFGASMTSFAATGWVEENNSWVYYDADGDMVTSSWKKSGNDWYYLDDDGNMSTNKKIDNYFVNEDGKMVINKWAEISSDDDDDLPEGPDTNWYYFGSKGAAEVGVWKKVNNSFYLFDDEGKMQTGWQVDGDKTYYLGDENDGTMKTGWMFIEPQTENDNNEPADAEKWFFFKSNGERIEDKYDYKVNGKYYAFDDEGIMQKGWTQIKGSDSDADKVSNYKYYGSEDDGSRASGWLKVETKEEVHDVEGEKWFYFDKGAAVATDDAKVLKKKTINNKMYAFNEYGEMVNGLKKGVNYGGSASGSNATYGTYYFGTGDDGAMKTGKQNVYIEDDDETYVYYFITSGTYKGQGLTGIKDNYLYSKGKRQEAEDGMKYQIISFYTEDANGNIVDWDHYLVNETGKIKTSGTATDADGNKFTVKKLSNGKYEITVNGTVYVPSVSDRSIDISSDVLNEE